MGKMLISWIVYNYFRYTVMISTSVVAFDKIEASIVDHSSIDYKRCSGAVLSVSSFRPP